MAFTAGLLVDIASGVLYLAIGVAVLLVRPRRAARTWFGLFAALWGVRYVLGNVGTGLANRATPDIQAVAYAIAVAAVVCLCVAIVLFPRRLERRDHGRAVIVAMLVLGLAVLGVLFVARQVASGRDAPVAGEPWLAFWTTAVSQNLIFMGALGATLLLALRRFDSATHTDQANLLAAGAGLYPVMQLAIEGWPVDWAGRVLQAGVFATMLVCIACLAARGRVGRGAAAALAASAAVGTIIGLVAGKSLDDSGINGLVRTAGVFILAYAVLRHQLFDIDLKLKWTINRGTLAAVFLAVFFIVNQLVQVFAGKTFGAVAGAVASGLLLFALSPLQRIAERVADRAVPGVAPVPQMNQGERVEVYRRQAAIAWADGRLDAAERALLDGLRATLGITADEALQAERDAAARPPVH